MDFDKILEEIGEFGRYQKTNYLLICLPVMFAAANSLSYVFTAGTPRYRCLVPECESTFGTELYPPWLVNATPGAVSNGKFTPEKCYRYEVNDSVIVPVPGSCPRENFNPSQRMRCNEWVYDPNERTIVQEKIQRPAAIVIMNGNGKLQNIINKLYLMDVKMAVRVNATSREIKHCIKELTQMDGDELSDIICVIEAPMISDYEFKTKDGTLHVTNDILVPIFCVEGWETKTKLIITNGLASTIMLNPTDGEEYKPIDHGQNVAIVTSNMWPDFIETFVTNMVNTQGNFEKVVSQMHSCRKPITFMIALGCKSQIKISSPNYKLNKEFLVA